MYLLFMITFNVILLIRICNVGSISCSIYRNVELGVLYYTIHENFSKYLLCVKI